MLQSLQHLHLIHALLFFLIDVFFKVIIIIQLPAALRRSKSTGCFVRRGLA